MRNAALYTGVLLAAVALAGCSSQPQAAPTTTTPSPTTSSAPTSTSAAAPGDPVAATTAQCPYLSSDFVADANGEKVTKVMISADKPHPACFFYSFGNDKQLVVQVYVGDAGAATALVNKAAPISSSDKADLPGGWSGGSEATSTGAVYAVSKAGAAVVAYTDQKQTIKAKQVVKQAIAALGL
ncbi:DUF2020 domain-containing protein [Kutzneria sp. CA-103260]|uniref:DUF2020 domain-containing protein n=1 Tax=Kutzneria sp. CA-103260 TaxID=2802641 RepID=UPI001BA58C61|nr:DUF2020 domain-containing protein [Kutzneria sp. CA-103260]QUQ69987.1 hypothetical protein JJ691_77560 [Kutzneria sp. CA-103260]